MPRLTPRSPVPLPHTITAKISSEAAGYISLTPVARQELPLADLVERILAMTGKDAVRIRQILSRGSFVSGSARYRWPAFEASEGDLASLLARFPDPDPTRPFEAARCRRVVLHGARGNVEIDYDAAAERRLRGRLLRKRSYWDVLIPMLEALTPEYQRYSYADRADVYRTGLPLETAERIHEEASLLKFSTLIEQVRRLAPRDAELFVER